MRNYASFANIFTISIAFASIFVVVILSKSSPAPLSLSSVSPARSINIANTRLAGRFLAPSLGQRTFSSSPSSSVRTAALRRGIVACSEVDLIREVGKDSYETTLKEAGDKLVLVDFYTDWCGPCKMIYPYLEELARDYSGSLEIVKVNCAGENRELVNELGVRVLPTFMFYKNEKNIATVKGAKRDDLKNFIAENTA
uniref:Chloroplast thioredoxin F-type n=1 Tax=Gymnochlora stellata TaxID=67809 RepID=B5A4J9_GYMST|nr:chloroplast thioredoxin F-type [Gymnochlora stellata]